MGKSRLYWRHFLITGGTVLLSFTLLAVVFISTSYQYTIQESKARMESNALHVAELTGTMLSGGYSIRDENFRTYVNSVAGISSTTVLIFTADGDLAYCSDPDVYAVDGVEARIPRYILEAVILEDSYAAMTTMDGQLKETCFAVGKPVDVQTVAGILTVGIVFVMSPSSAFVNLWGDFAAIFFIAAVLVLVICLFSASVIAGKQTKPLKQMAEAARAFGHGSFDVRVADTGGEDELADLARAFNAMAESLSQSESRRREFVANISHELKTPMTTIAGFVDGMLDGTIPQSQTAAYLQVVSSETKRLSRLVRKMLELSQLQANTQNLEQGRFDIVEVMSRVLVSLESRITGRGLDVDADLPEEPVWVRGSEDDITQVCYNLLDNAIKFSDTGTVIGISIGAQGTKARLCVMNHGETIPPQEQEDIFERFHKTDRSRSRDKDGVGLGLYIVKSILNQHGESIALSSENGVTEFVFTLTLAQPLRER